MGEKVVTIRLNYDGIFKKDSYAGGKSFAVSKVDTEEFSYSVLMEFIKDYLHLTEIGGICMGDDSGWKLLTNDKELLKLVDDGCENKGEIVLYVDMVVEREIEPSVQMQPWCGNIESGSIAAYMVLRERQAQNIEPDPIIEDVGESSLPNADEEEVEPGTYISTTDFPSEL
ncbi:hypothetical protein ACET3Z_000674 [Daucus carota]